ncbi:tetratricopeptide repeat protein, partial [candidate division KSB3 bacterium]|nr:tetratricopeptide repeat protein [candidate division KSB3 bacterium]MBD3324810.1 tetratricopeptide repeat protein [candidate division KSB3 bacterium]
MRKIILLLTISLLTGLGHLPPIAAQDTFTLQQRQDRFMQGVQAFEAGDYDTARERLAPLIDHYPELEDYTRYVLAQTFVKLEQPEEALALFRDFLARFPDHPLEHEVQFAVANLLVDQEQYAQAIPLYTALQAKPDVSQDDLHYHLGQALFHTDQYAKAVQALQHMIIFYPKHAQISDVKSTLK